MENFRIENFSMISSVTSLMFDLTRVTSPKRVRPSSPEEVHFPSTMSDEHHIVAADYDFSGDAMAPYIEEEEADPEELAWGDVVLDSGAPELVNPQNPYPVPQVVANQPPQPPDVTGMSQRDTLLAMQEYSKALAAYASDGLLADKLSIYDMARATATASRHKVNEAQLCRLRDDWKANFGVDGESGKLISHRQALEKASTALTALIRKWTTQQQVNEGEVSCLFDLSPMFVLNYAASEEAYAEFEKSVANLCFRRTSNTVEFSTTLAAMKSFITMMEQYATAQRRLWDLQKLKPRMQQVIYSNWMKAGSPYPHGFKDTYD